MEIRQAPYKLAKKCCDTNYNYNLKRFWTQIIQDRLKKQVKQCYTEMQIPCLGNTNKCTNKWFPILNPSLQLSNNLGTRLFYYWQSNIYNHCILVLSEIVWRFSICVFWCDPKTMLDNRNPIFNCTKSTMIKSMLCLL